MGLLDIFGKKEGGGLLGENAAEKAFRALALANNDYRTAAALTGDIRANKASRRESEQERQVKAQWKSAYRAMYPQATDAEAELAWGDTKGVGNAIASGNESYTLGPGAQRRNRGGLIAQAPTALEQEANFGAQATPDQIRGLDITRPLINNSAYGQQVIPRTSLPTPRGPSREEYEAELRRRGLIR